MATPQVYVVVAGDTLYARMNSGLAVWDLTPLWNGVGPPQYQGNQSVSGLPNVDRGRFYVDSSFGYLLLDGTYRVFDLR